MPNYYYPNYNFPNYPVYQPSQLPQQMPIQTPQTPQQTQTTEIRNGGFISVGSEAEARNYPVAPGNSVTFYDANSRHCYEKTSVSQLEAPKFKRYRLVEEEETPVNAPVSGQTTKECNDITYATQEQVEAVRSEIEDIKAKLEMIRREYHEPDAVNEPNTAVSE